MTPHHDQPRISVVMAVYNGRRYLPEAVESILRQTMADFEFIIIDDGSTDGSTEWLDTMADPRIRLVHQGNIGLTKSLNRGLAMARGEFIARMDADDISLPERFERQLAYMEQHPNCAAVGTSFQFMDPLGRKTHIHDAETDSARLSKKLLANSSIVILHPSTMLRQSALARVGGYRAEFARAQDYDLWLRLDELGELGNLSDVLMLYRVHADRATSQDRRRQLECADKALADAYARRGLEGTPPRYCDDERRYPPTDCALRERWMLARHDGKFIAGCVYASQLVLHQPRRIDAWRKLVESICGSQITRLMETAHRWARSRSRKMKPGDNFQRPNP